MHSDNPEDYELAHYGIKGMKWGIRRKTNSDGLVIKGSAPEKEYSSDAATAKASREKAQSKGVQSLTNDELKALNERMNLEQNYDRLNPAPVKKGRDYIGGITKTAKVLNDVDRAVQKIPGMENVPGMNHPAVQIGRKILRGTEAFGSYASKVRKFGN